ncbi:hypothetical protein FJ444_20335 [Aestuariibacter sp. GS-14]|nr:hypothetical protein FJ444_20335 [Aestuariibacter sp. GS-14]
MDILFWSAFCFTAIARMCCFNEEVVYVVFS